MGHLIQEIPADELYLSDFKTRLAYDISYIGKSGDDKPLSDFRAVDFAETPRSI